MSALAQAAGGREQGIEHLLQVESRAADHLEHFGGGGLLLQRLREVVRARLHFVEQAYISMAITA